MIITKSNHLILGAILLAKSNDALNEQIKSNLTPEQLQDLKDFYVERLIDNMDTKDLVRYVTDDMTDYVNKLSPVEFFEEGYNYWEDYFDEIVEDFKGGQSENDLNQDLIMKYNSPYEIGVGDVVSMKDDTGYITEHCVAFIDSLEIEK